MMDKSFGLEAPNDRPSSSTSGTRPSPVAERWVFDTVHSTIQFSVRRMVVSRVRGQFGKWRGSMTFNESNPRESLANVRIESNSIDTSDTARDTHLRSADFLDAENHPVISFDSTRVEVHGPSGVNRYAITGQLSIRGVTKEVVLECEYRGKVRDTWGNERMGFSAKATVSRAAFGLTWNQVMPAGELLIGDDIEVSIDIEAMRAPFTQV